MYLTERIKIAPPPDALAKLWEVSARSCEVWNLLNQERREAKVGYLRQKKFLPLLKRAQPEYQVPSSQVLQEVVKSLQGAWASFFTKRKHGDPGVRPPGFKSRTRFFTQKYPQARTAFQVAEGTLRLAYGQVPGDWIVISLPPLKADPSTYKTVTISYDEVQHVWYASFTREVPLPAPVQGAQVLVFDPGCKTALMGLRSDRTVWEYDLTPLRTLNLNHYHLIDRLTSARDTKVKGSRLHRRFRKKVKRLYRKLNTQTKQYLHKLANQILADHPDVARFQIGDWDKRATLADTGSPFVNHRINRTVQNANPLQRLVGYLSYKAALQGKEVTKVDEEGTTRTCSDCHHVIAGGLPPSVRTFRCPACGFTTGRDLNSTLNLMARFHPAVWHGLRGAPVPLRSARRAYSARSGTNRPVLRRTLILHYQDARGL